LLGRVPLLYRFPLALRLAYTAFGSVIIFSLIKLTRRNSVSVCCSIINVDLAWVLHSVDDGGPLKACNGQRGHLK
jgi:hypothetical protein